MPLQPAWALVYASQWVFSFLPVFIVRGAPLRRRAVLAYLTMVSVAYAGFLLYPTVAPRPSQVAGDGFFAWSLRGVYGIDPPYNCFPSLHVAYSSLAALVAYHVHRGVGRAAVLWAAIISVSTLFTRQHYVVDIVAGVAIAYAAYALLVRRAPRAGSSGHLRRAGCLRLGGLPHTLSRRVPGLEPRVRAGARTAQRCSDD